uniref:Uncharacterized protein n=1 Tax=Arundo donax TaxID=35708 RepID=A0A0A9DH45_ARUDO
MPGRIAMIYSDMLVDEARPFRYSSCSLLPSEQFLMACSTACLTTFSSTFSAWLSPPTASGQKVPAQDAVASSTLRPSSSNASRIETSSPGQVLSENTLTRNPPCPRVSTVTDGKELCLSAPSSHVIS